MTNPKWSEMKQTTDKELRRRAKEREAQSALEREAREKAATRNKIVFFLIALVCVACLVAAWFMVSGKRAEIDAIRKLGMLALEEPAGTLGFREANGVWTRETREAVEQGHSVSTVPDGRVRLALHEGRSVALFPGSELTVKEIKPLGSGPVTAPDAAGVHIALELASGAAVVESRKPVGYVALQAGQVGVKANPRTIAYFKAEYRKAAGATSVRVAVREGEVQVKSGDRPAIRLADRQEIIFSADGKFEGPRSFMTGSEAWR